MKRIFLLPGLYLLAACSGATDAYTIGHNVDTVGRSNAKVTGMRTSVDNRLEVIAYAQSVGVVPIPESTRDTGTTNSSRVGVRDQANNRFPNVRDPQSENIGRFYDMALTAFKNMYAIAQNGIPTDMDDTALKNAYLIAGGDQWPDELTADAKNTIAEFIKSQVTSTEFQTEYLDKFFNKDTTTNEWIFDKKTETLEDVNLKTTVGDQTLTFELGDDNKIIAAYLNDVGYTRNGDGYMFTRPGTETDVFVNIQSAERSLQYADYGRITVTTNYADSDNPTVIRDTFAGGYDLKNITRDKVVALAGETDMNFKGRATGFVNNSENQYEIINGDATLNIMNNTETLDMKFSDNKEFPWYDVKIVDNGTTQAISFKPGTTKVQEDYTVSEPNKTIPYDGMNIKYYGDRETPSEFVGTATYTDSDTGVSMNAAFGGALVKPTE